MPDFGTTWTCRYCPRNVRYRGQGGRSADSGETDIGLASPVAVASIGGLEGRKSGQYLNGYLRLAHLCLGGLELRIPSCRGLTS